jgi:hypothetical protein
VRLQKPTFTQELLDKNIQIVLLLSYHAKKIHDYKDVDEAVTHLLKKITNEITD